ncbi:CopY/TcrY family copper transport repressor [Liquorilactobacillus nagelii]|uniref:Uracil phosphoribosyltransferase n=1 Tax=Liquorilactobacillus nagelii TaxID=82688 RepID=A0A3Q8CYT0_9LACO|nr:CopY/TcrY family copper transport repressor [Liquorilactobacillus nagelii]AUJ31353.1 uracil phosphoribosyltransferase [Liquorilactobacillus nagelii]MCC7616836.1 CopY/TcrY family copper transport repressor [Liquorilactobacillus nagelii]MCP9315572.1 CopY/TcrY family copper transport repressor [Liquorilactobacillus nagelii]
MKNKKTVEISDAEWEIMRMVWTLQTATSRKIIDNLKQKKSWKEATVKTLLRRLVQKEVLRTTTQGRSFIYHPVINEQEAINLMVRGVFQKICQHHVGTTLLNVVQELPLAKGDIEKLQQALKQKYPNAPEELPCDCLPGMHQVCCSENESMENC